MKNKINIFRKTRVLLLSLVTAGFMVSCVGDELFRPDIAESNSQIDTVFPTADFSYVADAELELFNKIYFTNLSTEENTYLWDFGVGEPLTSDDDDDATDDEDATVIFPGEGTYPVTLTVSDSNGKTDSITMDVVVVQPEEPEALIPVILEPGFDNGNDSRDVWRNGALGGVIQITGSNGYYEGSNGAKLPSPGSDRIGYQLISEFSPNFDYVLRFKYRMKDNVSTDNGLLHVKMLTATDDPADIVANTVASVTYSEAVAGTSELVTGTLSFNSGTNTSLAIFFFNEFDEAYIDSFTIELQ